MLRKKKLAVWMATLVVGLICLGGCRHPSPERMADRVIGDLAAKLELNAAQQQQLQAIKTEMIAKATEMRKARQPMREEVLAELQKDTLDQEKLRKMVDRRKAAMEEITNLAIARLAQFHGTLSPEQKKKLVEYVKEKGERHRRCSFDR